MKVLIVATVLLFGCVQFGPAQVAKLPIQIFYGAKCPDSIRFFQNQLYPLYNSFSNYVDFTYIISRSFSTVHENGTVTWQCQQGPDECVTSLAQVCALDILPNNPGGRAAFLGCQMNFNVDLSGQECAEQVGIAFYALNACAKGSRGAELLQIDEQMAKEMSLNWVPTIVYNWQWNQDLTSRSEFDLKTVICEQINHIAPICQEQ